MEKVNNSLVMEKILGEQIKQKLTNIDQGI